MATILADDIFKCIFMNENAWISLKISLKFAPEVRINNIPALVQVLAWCNKPLSEPMLTRFTDAYAALGGDELTHCGQRFWSIPEPMLTSHYWDLVPFNWEYFTWGPKLLFSMKRLKITPLKSLSHLAGVSELTTHLLSNECTDWPKLHDMFKACDTKTWQREFPVGFPVRVCDLNLLLINIFHNVVDRIESRCMIKAKYVLLVCKFVRFFAEKTLHSRWSARSCNFSPE